MTSEAIESPRLQVVARVRDFQRDWLERTGNEPWTGRLLESATRTSSRSS